MTRLRSPVRIPRPFVSRSDQIPSLANSERRAMSRLSDALLPNARCATDPNATSVCHGLMRTLSYRDGVLSKRQSNVAEDVLWP
jgi:hypothetical protein